LKKLTKFAILQILAIFTHGKTKSYYLHKEKIAKHDIFLCYLK